MTKEDEKEIDRMLVRISDLYHIPLSFLHVEKNTIYGNRLIVNGTELTLQAFKGEAFLSYLRGIIDGGAIKNVDCFIFGGRRTTDAPWER